MLKIQSVDIESIQRQQNSLVDELSAALAQNLADSIEKNEDMYQKRLAK